MSHLRITLTLRLQLVTAAGFLTTQLVLAAAALAPPLPASFYGTVEVDGTEARFV